MYGFKAFVFNGKKTAGKAFETLEDHMPVYPWIDDAAVVSRNKLGFIRIHSTWAQDDTAVGVGTGLGAMTGGLLGVLLGPGGARLAPRWVAQWALCSAPPTRSPSSDPRLDDFAASLAKDTSALILVGEKASSSTSPRRLSPSVGRSSRPTSTKKTSRP